MLRLLALLMFASPVAAQDIPSCTAARAGATACLSGKLCACGFARGGSVAGRPDGWRWDCGALRPACGEALAPPALPAPMPLPPQFLLQMPGAEPPMTPWPR